MYVLSAMLLILVPPPSSDKRKWWLDHNASSKADIPKPPGEGWVLNPNRPTNPFEAATEPDWIKVDLASASPGPAPVNQPRPPLAGERKLPPPPPPPRRQQSERIPPPSKPMSPTRRLSSASLDGRSKPPVPPKPNFISARKSVPSSPSQSSDQGEFKPTP